MCLCDSYLVSLALDLNIRTACYVEYYLSDNFHMCGCTQRILSKQEAAMHKNQSDLVGVTDQALACAM